MRRVPDRPGTGVTAPAGAAAAGNAPAGNVPAEEMRSARLVLRRVHADHAEAIAAAVGVSLAELRPWMAWANLDAADPRTQLNRVIEADELWEAGSDYIYSVLLQPRLAVVGEIGLHRRAADGGMEIGYWIDSRHVRRGIGTEAAGLLTETALSLDGVTRAEIHCDEANRASAAIPRKLGYQLDRIDRIAPEAPGELGRRMIWVRRPVGSAARREG
jgi:RimJ/RimL family protein N-acetyltransferase